MAKSTDSMNKKLLQAAITATKASDIKKLLQWYNLLVKAGITDFEKSLKPTEGDNIDDRVDDTAEQQEPLLRAFMNGLQLFA